MNTKLKTKTKDVKQVILYVVLSVGAIIILRDYIGNRSFWIDEAMLGLNMSRSFGELLKPLDYGQMSPILFLYAARVPTLFLGIKDYVLRIVPLLAGLGSLYVFYLLSKKIVNKSAAIIALLLFIFSESLIYYSTEFKQYSIEVFFAVLFFCLFIFVTEKGLDLKRSILIGFLGGIAVWFSYSAIFVVASFAIVSLYYFIRRKNKKSIIGTLAIGSIWLTSALTEYFFYFRRENPVVDYMADVWGWTYMPFPPRSLDDFLWLPVYIKKLFIFSFINVDNPITKVLPVFKEIIAIMLIIFFIAGIVYLIYKKKGHLSFFVLMIMLIAIIGSALRVYPFYDRAVLYLAPLVLLFSAIGIWLTIKYLSKIHKSISILLLIFIFIFAVPLRVYYFIEPNYQTEVRSVVNYYHENRKPGDKLLVQDLCLWQFYFYSDRELVDFTETSENLDEIYGNNRVWVIQRPGVLEKYGKVLDYYMMPTLAGKLSEKWPLNKYKDRLDKIEVRFNSPDAEIYLYDLSGEKP